MKRIILAIINTILPSERFLWRLGHKFGNNNNMWFLFFWSLFFISLIFNLIVFGFGYIPPEIEPERQSILSSFREEKNDFDLLPWHLKIWNSSFVVWIWGWMSYLSWMTTLFLFIAALISVIVLVDEISRAFRAANIKLRERREGKVRGPAISAQAAPSQGATETSGASAGGRGALSQPLTFRSFLIWEFLIDFLTELSLFRR